MGGQTIGEVFVAGKALVAVDKGEILDDEVKQVRGLFLDTGVKRPPVKRLLNRTQNPFQSEFGIFIFCILPFSSCP